MPDNHPNSQKVNRQLILAAIQAVKQKGWDLNPYTVGDEAQIAPVLIYRDPELMKLINAEPDGSSGKDAEAGFEERASLPAQKSKATARTSASLQVDSDSQGSPTNGHEDEIYNVARTSPQADQFDPMIGLTWKDIQSVYHMKVASLKDYVRSIPGPNQDVESTWFSDDGAPVYRPYLSWPAEEQDLKPLMAPGIAAATQGEQEPAASHYLNPVSETTEKLIYDQLDTLGKLHPQLPGTGEESKARTHGRITSDRAPHIDPTDASASPFQKLKISSGWPRPSSSQKPINLQEAFGKSGKSGHAESNDNPSVAPIKSAQEKAWAHFIEGLKSTKGASPPTPPPVTPEVQARETPQPAPDFSDVLHTASPAEQMIWDVFNQPESQPKALPPLDRAAPNKDLPFDSRKEPTTAPKDAQAVAEQLEREAIVQPIKEEPMAGYSDLSIAGPHYSFGFGLSNKSKRLAAPQPEEVVPEVASQISPGKTAEPPLRSAPEGELRQAAAFAGEPLSPPVAESQTAPEPSTPLPQSSTVPAEIVIVEPVPDLETLDIFDDLDHLTGMAEVEVIEEAAKDQTAEKTDRSSSTISGDELREIVKSRIKQASEHLAEQPLDVTADQTSEGEGHKKVANRSKFVGAAKAHQPPKENSFFPRTVPTEIRKACLLLGVRPEEINKEVILDAWKRQIASPGVHPDLGGDTESAIYLNTAKDTLIRWLEAQAPKLGKRFGQTVKTRAQTKPDNSLDKAKKGEKSE